MKICHIVPSLEDRHGGPSKSVRALANQLETRNGISPAALRMFGMLPYVVSLAALAGVAGKSGSPAALGKAYQRE